MRVLSSVFAAFSSVGIIFAVAHCSSSGDSGFGGGASTFDAGPGASDASANDATMPGEGGPSLGNDAAPSHDAGTGPVSPLALEQVWFITGSSGSGDNTLIDFRTTPPSVTCITDAGFNNGFEGSAVFTDPTKGDLLFYTDGRSVLSGADRSLLANGDGLNGDPSAAEPALITPMIGTDGGSFYVFTNDTNDTSGTSVYYSTIDLFQGAHGTVTTKNQLLLTGDPGEGLDVLPHTNGTDFWILTYDTAAQVKAFLVTASGVSTTPVISPTGLTGTVLRAAINHALDYDHVVLAMSFGSPNGTIATATMDRSTGQLSNVAPIVTGDLGYDAAFSKDGRKLYYVRGSEGWYGVAYQYDLDTSTETSLGGSNLAAAKLAPDGKVYWTGSGHQKLGVVEHPDVSGAGCGFTDAVFDLGGCTVGFGVPNQTAAYLSYLPNVPK